ncbi:MAG: DUF308 domain-containing protein [Verrucomicrobia bacterium]|nr:DUF308 domain-containing protein [Verrucomicrobiota bacterium]
MNRSSRGWLIASGILSIFVGLLALGSPLLFSLMLVQFLGIFALVSGVISLVVAIFGKGVVSRGLSAFFAVIRIAAGVILLYCIPSGLNLITLIFAAYLMVEGIFSIFGAFRIRQHRGWIFMLINGIITLAFGVMVYVHWPTGAAWILGFFLGLSLFFHGLWQLIIALSAPPPSAPAIA